MSKKNTNKKKSTGKKILIGLAAVIVVVIIAAGIFWFSMPKEMRNMMLMMVFPAGGNYDNYTEYQVIDYRDEPLEPSSFDPVAAVTGENDDNVNVAVITQMVQNEDSGMLKKGNVTTVGAEDYNGWYVLADEGAMANEYPFGPSPLSYYTAGTAANLHTQIIKAAEVKGVELNNVTVEVRNTFRWDNMMAADGTGHLDVTTVSIIIESDLSEDVINEIKEMALNSWTVGEALMNETNIEPQLVVNGNNWDEYRAAPGTSYSGTSYNGDDKLSSITDVPRTPERIELSAQDEGMSMSYDSMSNMQFEIYAISESAGNADRPYLKTVTISTPTAETWEIYSDEFMSEDDTPLAPTSLEYFTMGTALCLTSQTTLVSAMLDLDCTEYRVENQTDYRIENVGSEDMQSYCDTVHSYVLVESDASQEELETFFYKSLSLCFAGEGLKNETEMDISVYLNGSELD